MKKLENTHNTIYINVYIILLEDAVKTAKIFMNGRSEAVRLPKDCRFGSREVYVKKIGDLVMLIPKEKAWDVFLESLKGFSDDYMNDRPNEIPQKRAGL